MAFPPYTPDFQEDITFISKQLTTRGEMERLYSYKGVSLHLDDADDNDENYLDGTDTDVTPSNIINEVIDRATAEVMEYLAPRYNIDDIRRKTRIRELATIMACHRLSMRRGNEPIFDSDYAEAIETLERYREGTLYLNAPSSPRAYVQSYVTDMRYIRNPTRVLSAASTKVVSGQHAFWESFPFFWL